ncbi:MAG: FkbM family methyltransferase [Parcubacteria group bacterium]|jgi:FkbM family methyltransferase
MIEKIYNLYAYIFCRKIFRKFNRLIYQLGLRGLGVLNYKSSYLTGENIWLKKYLDNKKSPIVIDVGANVGNYSSTVLKMNNSSIIFAFEPHPRTYQKLINKVKSDNFTAYNVAVGNESGVMKLYDYDCNDGSSHASLYKNVIEDLHKGNAVSHLVDVISLDSFIQEHNIREIHLLKIDVEGNEFNVLRGVEKYIKNNQINAIHFEFNEMNIISRTNFKDFWDFLPNYNFYRILPGGELLKIKDYSPVFCEIYAFQNIIAILKK